MGNGKSLREELIHISLLAKDGFHLVLSKARNSVADNNNHLMRLTYIAFIIFSHIKLNGQSKTEYSKYMLRINEAK